MRRIFNCVLMALTLWFSPVSFMDEDTEGWSRGGRPCPSCPGGKCPPKKPRPSR